MDAGRQNRNACTAAVGALLQRLSGMAHKYASHAVVSELLSNAVQSMRNHVGQESLTQGNGPVPQSNELEIETF